MEMLVKIAGVLHKLHDVQPPELILEEPHTPES